ncbi:hypothetical protein Vi05172_g6169 [Venturia inaequalis]|nr:hypothetical protein Vi05172_g6169 [Venturia inaequalis]
MHGARSYWLTFGLQVAQKRQLVLSGYAPTSTACPAGSLLRPADRLSQLESAWVSRRKPKADAALASWLKRINAGFNTSNLPLVGLTISGGGYRSTLGGAGVIRGFDNRDSQLETSGLYQGLSYIAGLSGGSLLLSSIVGNNYPTMSSLKENLWRDALKRSIFAPGVLNASTLLPAITNDIRLKREAGFSPTLTDPYGRLLAYQVINSNDGGVSTTLSSVTEKSNFAQFNAPYPIITSLGIQLGKCLPTSNAIQYEFTPHEFGSWDKGVSSFTPTKYLGTPLSNGLPTEPGTKCTQNFDNLGYIAATSCALFSLTLCPSIAGDDPARDSTLNDVVQPLLNPSHTRITRDLYATYPNPFQNYKPAINVSSQSELYLMDGGSAFQNNPIWPFIQPASRVQVLLVNDNSADTTDNFPNGTEIRTTYLQAREHGLTRMPFIPPASTFVERGWDKRAVFFGCKEVGQLTIVYLPNAKYTYNSGVPTSKGEFSGEEVEGLIGMGLVLRGRGVRGGGRFVWGVPLFQRRGLVCPRFARSVLRGIVLMGRRV